MEELKVHIQHVMLWEFCYVSLWPNKRQHNKDERHSSLEKYTSHFIERVVCERELETEQNCNILTPTLLAITALLSRFPGLLNRGPGGQPLWVLVFSTASFLQLVWSLNCALSYIIVQRPPSSCGRHKSHSFNPSTVKVIFWYSSTGCTCYLHRCISYFDSLAGSEANIQQFNNNKNATETSKTFLVFPAKVSLLSAKSETSF